MKAITKMTTTIKFNSVEVQLQCWIAVPEGFIKEIKDLLMQIYSERKVICNYDQSTHAQCISIPFDPDLVQVVTHAVDCFKQFEETIDRLSAIAKDINRGE